MLQTSPLLTFRTSRKPTAFRRSEKFVIQINFGFKNTFSGQNYQSNIVESSIPPLVSENKILSTSTGKAHLFAQQFASHSTVNESDNNPLATVTAVPCNMPEYMFKV